eukprot:2642336-Amphidinium_carterae.1
MLHRIAPLSRCRLVAASSRSLRLKTVRIQCASSCHGVSSMLTCPSMACVSVSPVSFRCTLMRSK